MTLMGGALIALIVSAMAWLMLRGTSTSRSGKPGSRTDPGAPPGPALRPARDSTAPAQALSDNYTSPDRPGDPRV